ncbi:L-aspartate oxidase [Microbacterium sp.]|uniref:L-aspartate oxidase n=1 Tax=Microbacterium sp. TaxID=51671 RepID=UPI0039E6789E
MSTRVLVAGSGIAGIMAALHAHEAGCRVALVTKDVLEHANTRFAQGGIAAVTSADDSVDDHVRDTMVAGAGLCDPAAVRLLATEGPALVRELVGLGVAFDRDEDGAFRTGLEAAHSHPRILHAGGDATGSVIERALVERVRESGIAVIEHAFLADLVVEEGRVVGADLLVGKPSTGSGTGFGHRERIDADAVVLATGGAGQLYAHTTNPPVATGDGIAAALRAGASVQDLEFFQFHPTIVAAGAPFLVSEAVRGEGATLIDEHGGRFVLDAHPDGELAPRDVVARAIADRMAAQDGRPVYLDATGIRPTEAERRAFLAARFPTIDAALRERGIDWATEPVPVTPAAHYLMGGIVTDLDGRTTMPGLYAAGEAACTGVHGANRLASNSLLEGAVFGARVGDAVAADAGLWPVATASSPVFGARSGQNPGCGAPRTRESAPNPQRCAPTRGVGFRREALQELMWRDAGLVRDEDGLRRAAATIAAWRAQRRSPITVREWEDENLLLVAAHLVEAALARTGSVGAHHRRDDPGSHRDRSRDDDRAALKGAA